MFLYNPSFTCALRSLRHFSLSIKCQTRQILPGTSIRTASSSEISTDRPARHGVPKQRTRLPSATTSSSRPEPAPIRKTSCSRLAMGRLQRTISKDETGMIVVSAAMWALIEPRQGIVVDRLHCTYRLENLGRRSCVTDDPQPRVGRMTLILMAIQADIE